MPRVIEGRQCHLCGMHRVISHSIPPERRDKLLALAGDAFTCDMVCETCGVKRTVREILDSIEAMQDETSDSEDSGHD